MPECNTNPVRAHFHARHQQVLQRINRPRLRLVKPVASVEPEPTPELPKPEDPCVQHSAHVDAFWALAASLRKPPVRHIIAASARHFGLEPSVLYRPCRKRHVVVPRQIAMYLAREITGKSWPDIGRRIGGLDHTTVLHGYRKVSKQKEMQPYADALSAIYAALAANFVSVAP